MNSETKTRMLSVLLAVSVCAIAACGTQSAEDATRGANLSAVAANTPQTETPSGWTAVTWDDGRLEFSFPDDLITVTDDSASLKLTHSVPHTYFAPCDFMDDAAARSQLIDFDLTVTQFPTPVRETIRCHQVGFQNTDYLGADGKSLRPELIDQVTIGTYEVYHVFEGAEGCGTNSYYLQEDPIRTIYLTRKIITEFRAGIFTNTDTYLAVPGIISPDIEDRLFHQIAASIRVLH